MVATKESSTISPYLYSTGQRIYAEGGELVSKMLNYAAGDNPVCHFSFYCGESTSTRMDTFDVQFDTMAASWVEVFQTRIWIDEDTEDVEIGAECTMDLADVGEVRFSVGSTSATLSFTSATTTEQTTTVATSATGTGQQTVRIEIRKTAGMGTSRLRWVRLEDQVRATLASPTA